MEVLFGVELEVHDLIAEGGWSSVENLHWLVAIDSAMVLWSQIVGVDVIKSCGISNVRSVFAFLSRGIYASSSKNWQCDTVDSKMIIAWVAVDIDKELEGFVSRVLRSFWIISAKTLFMDSKGSKNRT